MVSKNVEKYDLWLSFCEDWFMCSLFHEGHLAANGKLLQDSHFKANLENVLKSSEIADVTNNYLRSRTCFFLATQPHIVRTKLWLSQHLVTPICLQTPSNQFFLLFLSKQNEGTLQPRYNWIIDRINCWLPKGKIPVPLLVSQNRLTLFYL